MTRAVSQSNNPLNNQLKNQTKNTLEPELIRALVLTALTLVGLLAGVFLQSSQPFWANIGYGVAFLAGGIPAAIEALNSLFKERKLDVDLLMVLAALGAASIGEARDGAILLFLFSLSNTLQDWAMGRTKRAIEALMDLNPAGATVRRDGVEKWCELGEIRLGDILLVKPGERIAADAKVLKGSTAVDESPITGESVPVDKKEGSTLASGTVNLNGAIEAEVLRLAGDSTLAKLIQLVEQAEQEKSPTETLAEKWESPYAGMVLLSVPVVFAVLYYGFQLSLADAWYRAMTFMVVASPCAVVISTPAVMLSAMAASARAGVLFKSSAALEVLGRLKTIALDKTGTLTLGKMHLTDKILISGNESENLTQLIALEQQSQHPVATAIVAYGKEQGISTLPETHNIQAIHGKGISAQLAGQTLWAGTRKLAQDMGATITPEMDKTLLELEEKGKSTIVFGVGQDIRMLVGVADTLRPESKAVIAALNAQGLTTVMLTGDRLGTAQEIARQIDLTEVRAELLPEHKLQIIKTLPAPNALVGDGVNDAPALNAASLGISLASGTDVAIESADIVLMSGDLSKLPKAIELARKANQTVVFNLSFAFAVIAVVGVLSIFGKVPLPLGVVAHEGGTVLVVFMGLRLLGFKF